jgi:ABC-type multidrug transport system fused ATPase/permease subunit
VRTGQLGVPLNSKMSRLLMGRQSYLRIQILLIKDSDAPALSNVSFTVRPGEKIGICGRTGR